MPTWIMLSTLTPEGVQTVRNNPARIREVNNEIEQLGATVKAQWATLGHFDFVNVVEAPDEKTMARVSLELGSRGTAHYESLAAIPIDDFIAVALGRVEGPRRRRRRARARARPRARPLAAAPRAAVRARQRRASARRRALLDADAGDPEALAAAAASAGVELVVVGPEAPLVAGLVDALAGRGRAGASGRSATPRGSRARRRSRRRSWRRPGCRPAAHWVVRTVEEGLAAIDALSRRCIKADGLAAGKGVVIAADEAEARAALVAMIEERRFGDHPVLVEEFLERRRAVACSRCATASARSPLAPARDFKRIGDGDTGPNTGGMGAFSPVAGDRRRSCSTRSSRTRPPAGASTSCATAARRSTASSTPA